MTSPEPPAESAPPGAARSRAVLVIVFTTILIDFIGFTVLIPVLPLYAERLGASGFEVAMIQLTNGANLIVESLTLDGLACTRFAAVNGSNLTLRDVNGQQSAAGIGNRTGHHNGEINSSFPHDFSSGINRSFAVQNIEDGFKKQQIDSTVDKTINAVAVILHEIIKGNVAMSRIIDVG